MAISGAYFSSNPSSSRARSVEVLRVQTLLADRDSETQETNGSTCRKIVILARTKGIDLCNDNGFCTCLYFSGMNGPRLTPHRKLVRFLGQIVIEMLSMSTSFLIRPFLAHGGRPTFCIGVSTRTWDVGEHSLHTQRTRKFQRVCTVRKQRTYRRRLTFLCNNISSHPTNSSSLYFEFRTFCKFITRNQRYEPKLTWCRHGGGFATIVPRYRAIGVVTSSLYWVPRVAVFDRFADQDDGKRLMMAVRSDQWTKNPGLQKCKRYRHFTDPLFPRTTLGALKHHVMHQQRPHRSPCGAVLAFFPRSAGEKIYSNCDISFEQ